MEIIRLIKIIKWWYLFGLEQHANPFCNWCNGGNYGKLNSKPLPLLLGNKFNNEDIGILYILCIKSDQNIFIMAWLFVSWWYFSIGYIVFGAFLLRLSFYGLYWLKTQNSFVISLEIIISIGITIGIWAMCWLWITKRC